MYREILVPLDGSDLAEHALPYATSLALSGHAALRLIRVVPSTGLTPVEPTTAYVLPRPVDDEDKARHDAEVYLNGLITPPVGDSRLETVVRMGAPAAMIADETRTRHVDLIIMSTHGRSGLQEWLEGSVALDVIRDSMVPVLVIPRGCERVWSEDGNARILVLLDGSTLSQEILSPAVDLSQVRGAEITLLRVADTTTSADAEAYLNSIAASLRKERPKVETHVVTVNDPVATALAVAHEREVDAIALATHGRTGLSRMVMGSVARRILHDADMPVLVYRPAAFHEPAAGSGR